MSAKGLSKDSLGITKLTKKDIENIENKVPNPSYMTGGWRSIKDKVIFQITSFISLQDPNNNSLFQRISIGDYI